MSETLQLQEVLHKSVLSDFSGGLNGKEQCLPMAGWTVKDDSQIAKVIHESSPVPHDGRIGYDANELCMLWIPGEIALTCCDNGGNMYHKTRLTSKKSVTLAVDADILNMNKELLMDGDEIQSSLILVKRRYPVEIPVPRPSSKTGGGDETNMEMIHTTLLMVTAHCQLHIKIPGKEAVTVPTTEDILEYGDGHSSKLQHTTSVDSGYGGPVSPDIGGGDGRNLSEPGDKQEQGPFSHTNSQNESISTDGNDVPQMSTRSSVDSGLGDGTSLSEQTTASISEQTMSEQATSNLLEQTTANLLEQMTANLSEQTMSEQTAANLLEQTSHAIQVAEESNGTSFPVVMPHGSGIVDTVKTSGDIIENQPVEADGAKLKHSSSVESGYESAASLGLGIGDSASLSKGSVIKDTQNKSGVFENRSVEAEAERGENQLTGGVPELKKPGDVIEKEFVRGSGAEGDNRAVGGVRELENAAMFRVQQEHIREEFHKADEVGQLARGELGEGVIGRPVRVESGDKDVEATVNNEKLKKEDSQDEGVIGRPVRVESGDKDVEATVNNEKLKKEDSQDEGVEAIGALSDFETRMCCDVLFAIWKDKTKDCPVAIKYFEEFYNEFSKGKDFVIKTFDDYHAYGVDVVCEAAHRSSKIMVFVAPKCSDHSCPRCSLNGKEPPMAYREKLFEQLTAEIANWKDQRIFVTVIPKPKTTKPFNINKLFQSKSVLKTAPKLKDRDANKLLKEDMIQKIIEKREKTVEFARQHEEKQKKKQHESQEIKPSLSLPLQRSSSNEKNGSPDSGIVCIDFDPDERKDVLIICHDDDVDSTGQLQARIKEAGQSLRIGTQESFHHLGLEKRQGAIENSDKVIIYASRCYAQDASMIKALDWEKAITDIQDKLVVVVPKGTSVTDYNDYKMNLKLMSAAATFFEDKITDMRPLMEWFSPEDQAKLCSYG